MGPSIRELALRLLTDLSPQLGNKFRRLGGLAAGIESRKTSHRSFKNLR